MLSRISTEKLKQKPFYVFDRAVLCTYAPTGIRTPVLALKGLRPSPLDDGGGQVIILPLSSSDYHLGYTQLCILI